MPQTSPMNWTILYSLTIMSIMNTLSHLTSEKTNHKTHMTTKFNLNTMSWNW